ncbi:MAG: peptide chain release factor N(5)-glutamine methyltransferase [Chloroflexi bacterium]|nr:peptide chain release factor N(5)-glutamine methyltransferase [Chloroflexota bacterium]
MTALGPLLAAARTRFTDHSTSPGLDAQLLMAHMLNESRAHVIAHPERELTSAQEARFAALVERRAAGEPMAYILGQRAFFDRAFNVTPAVLIPRPETETLVELAITAPQAQRAGAVIVDIGTGSGAIAITVAAHCPQADVHAVDISAAALDVARGNATLNGVTLTFHHGDLLAPIHDAGLQVDVLLANLPYIDSGVLPGLDVSRHEPALALDGGPDGLDVVRRLLAQAPHVLAPDALVLLEIGADQGERASDLARAALPDAQVDVVKDLAGLDRIVRAVRVPRTG